MGKWFRWLCPSPVDCLSYMMVGWIVGSVQFDVSVLSVFAILTNAPISVFGNNIWYDCYVPVIRFLVIILPSGVVILLDFDSILSIQVSKYFSVPKLFFARVLFKIFARNLFNFIAFVWFNCFACYYTIICLILAKMNLVIFLKIFLSPIFFLLWSYTITIDSNGCTVIEVFSTLFWIHCTYLLFFVPMIDVRSQVFVCCTQFFCIRIEWPNHLFIWLMVVSCSTHARSKVEVHNYLPHS